MRVLAGQAVVATFKYDGLGRRTEIGSSTSTMLVLNADRHPRELRDVASGTVTRPIYGFGLDRSLGNLGSDGSIEYHVLDHLASVVATTDTSGNVTRSITYQPWGLINSGPDQSIGFTGREWHQGTSLAYYRARYYDPTVGRFISQDPIRYVGRSLNLYAYVDNNPINFTDPSGLIKYHGNWCGPNWTGGKKQTYIPGEYYKPPVDRLDEACKTHDVCYFLCRDKLPCDQAARGNCMTKCDRELSYDAAAAGHSLSSPLYWWMKNNDSPDPGTNESCGCKEKK